MKRLLLLIVPCLMLWACGTMHYLSPERAAVSDFDGNCLANLQMGRDYAALGRYELAKEHLLLALAASKNDETRQIISHELKSVDLMIQTQR